ncbi:MAG: glycosyltransferase family 2 protein [Clostridia bacterium]|nr:glycosyltransferase family 2 protein [Clostridia bacterium]
MNPSVAIVLVNYNGYDDTVECVKSLLNISYDNYTIFLVDNASTEEKKISNNEFLTENTRLIQSDVNLGFSGGNNIAVREALREAFDYILLLNNDTTVEPDFLTELVATAENNRNAGIVTGKIYYYFERDSVWSAGGTYNRNTGHTVQFSGPDSKDFDEEKGITFATGCLMLIPARVMNKVGILDESYFLYSEDTDYCQRVILAGFGLIYTPKAVIYHKVSASTGHRSLMQQRYMMRNNLYMIKKYGIKRFRAYCSMSLQMLKHIVRKRRNLKPTMQGYMDFIRGKKGRIS